MPTKMGVLVGSSPTNNCKSVNQKEKNHERIRNSTNEHNFH